MLKQILLASFFLAAFISAGQISSRLEKEMKEASRDFLPVVVEFRTTVNWKQLETKCEDKNVSDWPKLVNRALMRQAANTQSEALEYLNELSADQVKSISSFYIVNVMILEAKPDVISKLAAIPDVDWIDLADDEFLIHDPIIPSKKSTATVNGVEPGLEAINAPEMWKLGYTGRGRLLYNYDTGVWATHPAFSNRFLGNYKPLSQSWYGLKKNYPDGRISNHGTHTLGTMAGLDTATNDTIGVAFGAYWMANDYVNSTVATLPPIAEMIQAFEWALNPDGDTSTSDDVPDVINNSWRWRDDPDTVQCGGYVVQLMNAIEAAGIANVFSGGNAGPNNSTISAPQRINTNKTSTFSVGSVNGNLTFPFPISSFSSRGPTQCPGTGNLKIHPEVVAPGQDVRSAWGTDGYNTISGTSMAAPHVSGAVLLLKEAFPQLSGTDLLNALYVTAIDMGTIGEDNTYGNGLIDVHAAYQHLAQSHTPVDPKQVDWDIAVKGMIYSPIDTAVTCWDNVFDITVTVENLGANTIDSFYVNCWLDGVPLSSVQISVVAPPNFTTGEVFGFTFPIHMNVNTMGEHELRAKVELDFPEYDLINNERMVHFNKRNKESFPFEEDFEQQSSFDNWYVEDEDLVATWETTGITNWTGNTKAVVIKYAEYFPRSSQKDRLWSPVFAMPSGAAGLGFDLAYQQRNTFSLFQDTLKVLASTDCGKTFPYVLYEKSDADLNTVGTIGSDYVPAGRNEWRREYVDLSSLAGQEVVLAFEGVNRGGNNLYLDNISIYPGYWDPVSLEELNQSSLSLYPNPSKELIYLKSSESPYKLIEVQILDMKGVKQSQKFTLNEDGVVYIENLSKGLYIMKVEQGGVRSFLRFLKE
ncbi:subtilisin-like serine protease [Owenweeksia hongkongensis DSM 17368]|uniref:Subtilisin-like serine protease n=1 Tax=Owenweeksia hongkongensis (strain DSM 17368 / CIP 108786 / JCM 12287 / NRRL B-23963 / UST20020801) TaxID=926562 RepID=G8R8X1_OWEHD|nr:S8 family serine peptidase [Owenweeksia hongkongensis]AEV33579.1 subtilisin-like serine protease [Owenweeksia hongkongensis DSM 17368]